MTSIKLLLNKERALKDGSYPLVFQLIHQRQKKLIYTPFRALISEFDAVKQKVVFVSETLRTLKEVRKINRVIEQQRRNIQQYIDELANSHDAYTVADVVSRYKMEHNPLGLLNYMDAQIARKQALGKEGTAAAYISTRSSFAAFVGKREVFISQVTGAFLSEYKLFLQHRGVCDNTICFYFRNLKAIYNQAVTEGHRVAEEAPFQRLSVKPQKTIKRAVASACMRKMAAMDLSHKHNLEIARDMYLFSFFSRGMPFVDVVFLKKPTNGIDYSRRKTKQWLRISVTPQLAALIKKYDNSSEYVFPIIDENDPKPIYEQYRLALGRTNRNLKIIGSMLELETPLTTYVARHSWATAAKNIGAPISVISEGLGHTSEAMTQTYLKEFDQSVLDEMNQQVSNLWHLVRPDSK